MLGFLALAVGDAFACSPCGGNGERGSCADRVSAAETKRRTPAQVFFLQERMIPPIKPQLSKKEMRIPMAMSRESTPLFSPMAKRVSAFAGYAPLLPACRRHGSYLAWETRIEMRGAACSLRPSPQLGSKPS